MEIGRSGLTTSMVVTAERPFLGPEVVPYVHNLYRHLAACDLAVV